MAYASDTRDMIDSCYYKHVSTSDTAECCWVLRNMPLFNNEYLTEDESVIVKAKDPA